jgi:TRAP-type transport system periplasmic protein
VRRRAWLGSALLLGALALGLSACGGGGDNGTTTSAAAGAKASLRLGYVTTPQHPYGIAVNAYAKDVASRSKGSIKITTIPNYQGGDTPLLNDVKGGAIECAAVSTAIWDTQGVNVFQPLQAPFLITNYPLDSKVLTGPIGKAMLDSPNGPAKLGLVGIGILEGGLRKPVGRSKAFEKPADFNGAKIRAPQSQVLSAGLKALGADPSPLPVGEVYGALQNGTVDGMEANLGLIYTNKYYEVAKFVTQNVNLWPFPAAVVCNKAAFDKLSSDQQAAMKAAGPVLATSSLGVLTNPNPPPQAQFAKLLCDQGLTFAFASKEDQAALATAVKPAYAQLSKDSEVAKLTKQIQDLKAKSPPPPAPPPLPKGCKTSGL